MSMALTQTAAIFTDAYRELNARKLFWITLVISALFSVALAAIGIDEDSIKFLWFNTPLDGTNDKEDVTRFYGDLFYYVGFKVWLTFGATILALVSTAGVFPDFIRSGAIDLMMSKPIGRVRLFLTKWLTGLMFAGLQITLFTIACFLGMGLRGGVWLPEIFWGIPLTIVFFSYLFAFCVLLGVLLRSTITALLLTGLLWAFLILLNLTDLSVIKPWRTNARYTTRVIETYGPDAFSEIPQMDWATGQPAEAEEDPEPMSQDAVNRALTEARLNQDRWDIAYGVAYGLKTVLPKTGETTSLLRKLMYPDFVEADSLRDMQVNVEYMMGLKWDEDLARELQNETNRVRGPIWIIGTSLVFEGICLLFAGWVFVRRDY